MAKRRARRNPGRYRYKISGNTPESYLKDLIEKGVVTVKKSRNQWDNEQEITEILSGSGFNTRLHYAETADYTTPTRFEIRSSYQSAPLAETIKASEAAEMFRNTLNKESDWNKNLNTIGLIMAGGIGLYLLSTLASRPNSQEIAQR